jgi:hypothetical protein
MRGADMRAVGEVAGEGLRVLNSLVRDVHKGIAGRVFASIGPAAKPVEFVHDSIAQTVYTSLSAAARRLPAAGGALASVTAADDSDAPLDENPVMGEVIAALNGIYGDELAARGNELATVMAVRIGKLGIRRPLGEMHC